MEIRTVQNDCVGCPQGCIHCGRDKNYVVIIYECDRCKVDSTDEPIYETQYGQLCVNCYRYFYLKDMNREELMQVIDEMEDDEIREVIEDRGTCTEFMNDMILCDADELNEVDYEDV